MEKRSTQFIFLVSAFICFTIVGTLSHEGGHYIMAKLLGYDAEINYGATFFSNETTINPYHRILITMGGPIETMLTGTIGIIILFVGGRSYQKKSFLRVSQWMLIFISLFWLRPVANLLVWTGGYLLTGKFSQSQDEVKISRYFHLPDGFILLITALLGLTVLLIVIFRFIPQRSRMIFTGSGLVGGVCGYILWLKILGPVLMP